MVSTTIVRQGLRLAGKIDRKYNINKIFIEKYFPPGYRKPAGRIVDIAGTLGGGYGLYGFLEDLLTPDTAQRRAQIPFKKFYPITSRKSYQTRGRPTERACRRYNRYRESNYR